MFKFLITPYLIDIFYILGVIFPFYLIYCFYDKIQFLFKMKKLIFVIIFMIIIYEIMLRVFCEFIIVYFNMYEELAKIGEKI